MAGINQALTPEKEGESTRGCYDIRGRMIVLVSVEWIGDKFLSVEGIEKNIWGFRKPSYFPGFHGIDESPIHAVSRAASGFSADACQNREGGVDEIVLSQCLYDLKLLMVEL